MAFLWLTSLIHATHTIFVSSVANGNERVQTEGHGNPVEFSRYEPTQWEEALQIKVLSDEKKRSESEKPSDSVFILGWIATESVLWSVRGGSIGGMAVVSEMAAMPTPSCSRCEGREARLHEGSDGWVRGRGRGRSS